VVRAVLALGLALLTFAAFIRVLRADFIMLDDDQYVVHNLHVHAGLNSETLRWAFSAFRAGTWQPLVWLSYALDYQLWELNPGGYHLTNLLLHVLSVIALYFTFLRMTNSKYRSAFVAALFAVHPLRVESVAWVAERKDVLSTLFWVLTMWAYTYYVKRPGASSYVTVFLLLALGLMAKPMLVTLPLVFLLLDYWPLARAYDVDAVAFGGMRSAIRGSSRLASLLLEKVPFFVLIIASSVIAYIAQKEGGAVSSLERLPLSMRISNALVSYVKYIWMMFWPTRLGVLYPHPRGSLPVWFAILSGLFLVIISVLAFRAWRRKPWLSVGWAWYMVTLLPVIGIVQIGPHGLADRFTYIPHIGIYVILAWGIPDLLRGKTTCLGSRSSPVLVAAACAVISAFAVTTYVQTGYWRSSVPLFKRTVEVTRRNPIILNNLGSVLIQEGRLKEAERVLLRALEIGRGARVENNLGVIAEKKGDLAKAEKMYRQAIDLQPTYPDAYFNLGNVLSKRKRFEEALGYYIKATRLNPESSDAAFSLGLCLSRLGRKSDAVHYYERALRLNKRHIPAHKRLAEILEEQGKIGEAVLHYRQVLALDPNDAETHNNLGRLLGQTGKLDEEIEHYRKALRIKPNLAEAHGNLAVALYFKGRYAEAWKEVELCRKYGVEPHPDFIKALREKLK